VGNNMNSRATPGVAVAETLPGDAPTDVKNPVERVRIAAPATGVYTVTVAATPVALGRQGFALAASGDIEPAGGEFTPGSKRQVDAPGAPAISDVRVDSISANTAKVHFSTSEPTTAKAVVNLAGAPTTFVDSYTVGTSGFSGMATPPVETSADYANRPVVSTRHEILLTGLAAGTTYDVALTAEDLGSQTAGTTVTHATPIRVIQANAADIGQLQQGSTAGWNTGTQLYAGDNAGNDLIGAFMFRLPPGAVNPAAITGAAVELTSSHNWVPFYTDDILLSVDLLDGSVEPSWGSPTQTYDTINAAPAAARVLPGTTHKRGAYFRYAFTFSCAELQALKNSLVDGRAAFRYQPSGDYSDALFAMDFGFNRRSRGPDNRPKLVLFTSDLGRGASPEGTACDPSTPAPTISDIGIHAGRNPGSVTVSWETDVDSDSFVLFREQGTSDWTQVGTLRRTRVHHVEVSGLDSSREYEFVVRSSACNGETTTDTNGGRGYDFFRDPPLVIPTEDWFFHGTTADQANKVIGGTTSNSSLYSATFNQTAPSGTVPVTQIGFGANPDFVANRFSNFWIAPYTGTIKGDVKVRWWWSTDNATAIAIGAGLNVSFFADPNLSPGANPVQPEKRIGQTTVRLSGLTPAPREYVTTVPVDGTVTNRLLIQAAPQFTDTGAGLTVYYDSVTTPSGFQIPLGTATPTEQLPLTGPAPPPSAGATGLVAPPTRLGQATSADIAAGTGACVIPALRKPDLVVSNITVTNQKSVREGEKVSVTATLKNIGNAAAGASQAEFQIVEDNRVLGSVATGSIAPGGTETVSVLWDTRSTKGTRTIRVPADSGAAGDEWNEENTASTRTVTVQGNKVENGDFSAGNSSGTGPASWSGSNTEAGTTTWSDSGTEGSKAAAMTATGGSAAVSGSPTWTSAPFSVTAGEVLDVTAAVKAEGLSSAPSLSLVYLGAAGQVLDTVKVLTAPLQTDGFRVLGQSVTIPPLVTEVRVVLTGFAPTDLATRGTVTFDDVGVFAR
jgi:hypothetical protein